MSLWNTITNTVSKAANSLVNAVRSGATQQTQKYHTSTNPTNVVTPTNTAAPSALGQAASQVKTAYNLTPQPAASSPTAPPVSPVVKASTPTNPLSIVTGANIPGSPIHNMTTASNQLAQSVATGEPSFTYRPSTASPGVTSTTQAGGVPTAGGPSSSVGGSFSNTSGGGGGGGGGGGLLGGGGGGGGRDELGLTPEQREIYNRLITEQQSEVEQGNMMAAYVPEELTKQFTGFLAQIEEHKAWAREFQAEGLAALTAQLNHTLREIDALQQQLMSQITGQMKENDPAMMAAIGLIRKEVERQRNQMLEEMNARGLTQSGILLEMEDRLNNNELTQVQSLLATRFGDLQNQLNNALMTFGQSRIQALGAHTQNVTNFMNNQGNLMSGIYDNMNRGIIEYSKMYNDGYNSHLDRVSRENISQNQLDQAWNIHSGTLGHNQDKLAWDKQVHQDTLPISQAHANAAMLNAQKNAGGAGQTPTASHNDLYNAAVYNIQRFAEAVRAGQNFPLTKEQMKDQIQKSGLPATMQFELNKMLDEATAYRLPSTSSVTPIGTSTNTPYAPTNHINYTAEDELKSGLGLWNRR